MRKQIVEVFVIAVLAYAGAGLLPTARPALAAATPVQSTAALSFDLVDGHTDRVLMSCNGVADTQASGVHLKSSLTERSGEKKWSVAIANGSTAQQWLLLRWRVARKFSDAADVTYWGGRAEPRRGDALHQPVVVDADRDTLPLQALFDNHGGVALGLAPLEIVSQLRQTFALSPDGRGGACQLEIPLVLDAGQSDSFAAEVFDFVPRYGYLDAVQRYVDDYPSAFWPRPDIDPRITGGGATYLLWYGNEPELARRLASDWEWCYAPFKRTGDIYGREEMWDYTSARPLDKVLSQQTAAQYREARKASFERGVGANLAMTSYVPAFLFCEIQLALQKYPDAIPRKPDGSYAAYSDQPWVTGHDNEVLMYPWGNSFGEQSQRDCRQLVEDNLNIQGFAYDVLNGGTRHRGGGMNQSPRRGFDENGVYVDTAVGVAKMMDFTRSLSKNGVPMALIGNPTASSRAYLTARTDRAIFEHAPYKEVDELKNLRLIMGHKPLCWWGVWDLSNMMNWQTMSGEEIRQAYLGARDYILLASLRYGSLPTPLLTQGAPKLVHWLAPLRTVIRAGWQPVPAVREIPDTLWPSRYGSGLGSYIGLGDAAREAYAGRVVIDNDYIGTANYLFAAQDGRPLRQRCRGRTTEVEVDIAAHDPLILRAVAACPAVTGGVVTVAWHDDGATGSLSIVGNGQVTQVRALPDGWKQGSNHGPGQWNYVSPTFGTPLNQLREFPFFGGSNTPATIVLPAHPSPDETMAAQRLQQYFGFWGRVAMSPTVTINLPIVVGSVAVAGPVIRIGTAVAGSAGAGAPVTLSRSGGAPSINVGGTSPRQTAAAMNALLDALDAKYFYAGKFPSVGEYAPGEAQALAKAGLAGGVLD